MLSKKRNIVIQILALAGLAISIKLVLIYITANYDKYALPSFCSVSEFVDCDGVAKSIYAQFLGIPLACWGVFFYLTVLFLTVVDKLKNIKFLSFLQVFKNPEAYITFLGTIAFACSMILAAISIRVINKVCMLCILTYFIDFIIALVACNGIIKNIITAYKTTFFDFIDGVKKYTAAFIIISLLAGSFLAYSGITYNFVPNVKRIKNFMKYRNIKYNPYRINGNVLGDPEGKVVIILYSDYVCPLCYINNIMLHQAVKEYKNVQVKHVNYPFDKACHPGITVSMHPGACFMSRAALAAKKQGNYWGMSSLLYENKPRSLDSLLKLADELNLDKEKFVKDLNSQEVNNELRYDILMGISLKLHSTPTMFINGQKYEGVQPYYKLKKILVKYGAQKR